MSMIKKLIKVLHHLTEGWTGDLKKSPFSELVKYFALEANTIDFIGHAVALYTDDSFLNLPSDVVLDKIRLYMGKIPFNSQIPSVDMEILHLYIQFTD